MSLLFDHLHPGPLILDASAAINLLGSGDMPGVLHALGSVCVMEERTFREVKRHPIPGYDHMPVLDGLRKGGLLKVERMRSDEYETYLTLIQGSIVTRLDDGESAAIALTGRGYPVILDERKARGVVSKGFPGVQCCSTLRMLLTAGKRGGRTLEWVQQLVLSARLHARLGVPPEEREVIRKLMDGVADWPSS